MCDATVLVRDCAAQCWRASALGWLILLASEGCGSQGLVPVSGKISHKDGTPVTAGMVNFEPVLGRQIPNPYPRLTWQPNMFWAAVSGVVAAVGVLALGGTTEFLYFQF